MIDESPTRQEICRAALEFSGARPRHDEMQRRATAFSLLAFAMNHVQQARHTLNFIDHHDTDLRREPVDEATEALRIANETGFLFQVEQVDKDRAFRRTKMAQESRLAGSSRSEQEETIGFRQIYYSMEHTP